MTAPSAIKKNHELTVRGFILACILTIFFTMANVYLGLKVGLTFTTSIPAAVISMSVLRVLGNGNILENNIVQTIASSAGTISAVVFILPGMVMIGFWSDFPFWQTFLLCVIGGLLGVMYTIPFRRALIVDSNLPYPEGRAAAETLKVGSLPTEGENAAQQIGTPTADIIRGTVISFLFGLASSGFKLLTSQVAVYGRIGSFITGTGFELSFALVGAGYLVGIRVAISLLIGAILAWLIAVPFIAYHHLPPQGIDMMKYAMSIWADKVRYIGAGTIAISAIWAFLTLLKPLIKGIKDSIDINRNKNSYVGTLPVHEQDIPIVWVLCIIIVLIFPLVAVLGDFISFNTGNYFNAGFIIALIAISVLLTTVIGFLVAGVSGYIAGLVGASASPLSGIGIIAMVIVSLVLSSIFDHSGMSLHGHYSKFIIALAILITSVIFSTSCISNDNLQDLSTGHIVGATPWKQQVALMFGVAIGALIISPVLNVLYQAYGFVGYLPHPGMNPSDAMGAPQAALMIALAEGIIGHSLDWGLMISGFILGAVFLLLNLFFLNRKGWQLSVLSIGIAIYLPPSISLPLVLGGILSQIVKVQIKDSGKLKPYIQRCGTLFASGLIVGTSLFGILIALLITVTGAQNPLALVGPKFQHISNVLGVIIFISLCIYFVRYITHAKKRLIQQSANKETNIK